MKKVLNYKPSLDFKEPDANQKILEKLYSYGKDISTRVFHRMRINLIYDELVEIRNYNWFQDSRSKTLDIGCNSGFLSKIIFDLGMPNVLGIDLSDEYIENANLNFAQEGLLFRKEDATKLSFTNKFNLILCTEVIEHTDNPKEVINAISRLLTDDGIAIISLPNFISLNYLITYFGKKILRKQLSKDFIQHIDYPFYKTLRLFEKEGFRILKTRGVNLFLIDLILPYIYKRKNLLRLDAFLSKLYPFKYFSQFFFIVITKNNMGIKN